MSVLYTVFDTTGSILRSGKQPSEAAAMLQGENVLIGAQGNDATQYVLNGALADRPTIPSLTAIPAGTQVFIDGVDHGVCDDGIVEIETDVPGTYAVHLEPPFPYQPFETDVVIE